MYGFGKRLFRNISCKCTMYHLAWAWLSGLIIGFLAAMSSGYFDFHGQFTSARPTFLSVLAVTVFPFLVSAVLSLAGQLWLIPCISFLKAFGFAYISVLVMNAYGSAGWLIQFLTMFSDCVSLPLLWWFWCSLLKSERSLQISAAAAPILVLIAAIWVDHRMILPFLSGLQI